MSQVELKLPENLNVFSIFLRFYLLFATKCLMFVVGCGSVHRLILSYKALNQKCQANKLTIKNLY